MKPPVEAVRKRVTKSKDYTNLAASLLISYGIFSIEESEKAIKTVKSKDTWISPSDLPFYSNQVENDLIIGRTSPEIEKIKSIILDHYGLSSEDEEEEDEIPEGFEDLLNEIRSKKEEKSEPSAGKLAIYEGTKGTDLVDEEIDERILRLLGLEDVFDIDYDTYSTLLKEKLISARMSGSEIPSEEDELIRNEFKRIKSKVGRFKIKKKKIEAEKFISKGLIEQSKDRFLLTNKAESLGPGSIVKREPQEDDKSKLSDSILQIKNTVKSIFDSLKKQFSFTQKKSEDERKDKERKSRLKTEDRLESIKSAGIKAIKFVLSPVQGILDKIMNFLTWIIIGRVVTKFFDWASNPDNRKKLESLGKFIKDWWPAILGAFVLFATPLGKFIRVVVGTIAKFTFKLLKRGIPSLQRFLKNRKKGSQRVTDDSQRRNRRGRRTNPKVTEGIGDNLSKKRPKIRGRGGLLGLGLIGMELAAPFISEGVGNLYDSIGIGLGSLSDEELLKEYKKEKQLNDKSNSGFLGKFLGKNADNSRLTSLEDELDQRGIAYNQGGEIFNGVVGNSDGIKVSGAGEDTQAFPVVGGGTAVLKPGELVLNDEQQKSIQRDTGIDPRSYVADAKPKQVNTKVYGYNSGGIIGGSSQGSIIPNYRFGSTPETKVSIGFNPLKGLTGLKGGGIIKMQNGGSFSRGTNQFGEVPLIRAALASGIKGRELAAFLAQMSHETGGFKWSRELGRGEGMGYSGGSRYHGRGYTQLTHDYNYRDFGNKLGVDLVKDPDLLLKDPNLSAKVAIQYWKERVRPSVKNWDDVFSHSAAINYPAATDPSQIRGYDDRLAKYNYYNKNLNAIINRSIPPKPKAKPKTKSKPRSFMDNVSGFLSGIGSFIGRGAYASQRRRQGGGEITAENLEKTYIRGQKSGMDPEVLEAIGDETFLLKHFGVGGTWRNFKGSGSSNMRGEPLRKKQGGGSITPVTTKTGYDIPGGVMGADTQYLPEYNVAVQPGEEIFKYVITKDAAEKGLGQRLLEFANQQQKHLDSNSSASNVVKNVSRVIPGPRRSNSNVKTLPPIQQRMGTKKQVLEKNGSKVPSFSIISPHSKRSEQMAHYGIITAG